MKTFLLATAAALGFGTASHAAIIRYDYKSAPLKLDYYSDRVGDCGGGHPPGNGPCVQREGLEYASDYDLADRFLDSFIIIDTALMDGKTATVQDTTSDYRPISEWKFSVGVIDATVETPYTDSWITFDDAWNIADFYLSYDGDQSPRAADPTGAWFAYTSANSPNVGYSGGPGTWTKTVLTPDAPAPVPLPAAGFLLMGALGGLGLMKRRNKAAA